MAGPFKYVQDGPGRVFKIEGVDLLAPLLARAQSAADEAEAVLDSADFVAVAGDLTGANTIGQAAAVAEQIGAVAGALPAIAAAPAAAAAASASALEAANLLKSAGFDKSAVWGSITGLALAQNAGPTDITVTAASAGTALVPLVMANGEWVTLYYYIREDVGSGAVPLAQLRTSGGTAAGTEQLIDVVGKIAKAEIQATAAVSHVRLRFASAATDRRIVLLPVRGRAADTNIDPMVQAAHFQMQLAAASVYAGLVDAPPTSVGLTTFAPRVGGFTATQTVTSNGTYHVSQPIHPIAAGTSVQIELFIPPGYVGGLPKVALRTIDGALACAAEIDATATGNSQRIVLTATAAASEVRFRFTNNAGLDCDYTILPVTDAAAKVRSIDATLLGTMAILRRIMNSVSAAASAVAASVGIAAGHAATALTQAGVATTKAGEAAASASAASGSATGAASSVTAAAAEKTAASGFASAAQGNRDIAAGHAATALAAASAAGPFRPYATKAVANAALSGLANGDWIEVQADESQGGQRVRYEVVAGAFSLRLALPAITAAFNDLSALGAAVVLPSVSRITVGASRGYKRVGSQPGHVLKAQDASGAWFEHDAVEVWLSDHPGIDITGATANGQKFREICYAAMMLKKPLRGGLFGQQKVKIDTTIRVGRLDDSLVASGVADGFELSSMTLVNGCASQADAIVLFENCTGVQVSDIVWDVNGSANGGGQIRFNGNVTHSSINNVIKIKTGTAFNAANTGGSAVSLRGTGGNRNCTVDTVITRGCGPFSSGVFATGLADSTIRNVECEGGQEIVDLSDCHRLLVEVLRAPNGLSLTSSDGIDVGSSNDCIIRDVFVNGCERGITVKTELNASSPYAQTGSNRNRFENITIFNYTAGAFFMTSGATSTHTLNNNTLTGALFRTATAAADCAAIRVADNDDGSFLSGLRIRDVDIEQNAGYWLYIGRAIKFRFQNITSNAPLGVNCQTPSSFLTVTNGQFINCDVAGAFTLSGMYNYDLTGLKVRGGGVLLANPIGCSLDLEVYDAPGDGLDIQFTNATIAVPNKELTVRRYRNRNNSVVTANRDGLRLRYTSTAGNIEGVELLNIDIADTQAVATSGYLSFGNIDAWTYSTLANTKKRRLIRETSTTIPAGAGNKTFGLAV